mgnify:CR=1 FL=1
METVMTRQEEFDYALNFVSELTKIATIDITSKSRYRDHVVARHFFRYFLRSKYDMNFQTIADFTNSNHATIIHSVRYVKDCSKYDRVYRTYKESIDRGFLVDAATFRNRITVILKAKRVNEFKCNALIDLMNSYVEEKVSEELKKHKEDGCITAD